MIAAALIFQIYPNSLSIVRSIEGECKMSKIQMPSTQLPILQLSSRAMIAPFKDHIPPYGAFANTTPAGDYPVPQVIDGKKYVWPSSEHAYHAQKLKQLLEDNAGDPRKQAVIRGMLDDLETLFSPGRKILLPGDFDKLLFNNLQALGYGNPGAMPSGRAAMKPMLARINSDIGMGVKGRKELFMENALRLKFQTHPELLEMAKEFARQGVFPVEVSQLDSSWGCGPDGKGTNLLGKLILKIGNENIPPSEIKIPTAHIDGFYDKYVKGDELDFARVGNYVNQSGRSGMPLSQLPLQVPTSPGYQHLQRALSSSNLMGASHAHAHAPQHAHAVVHRGGPGRVYQSTAIDTVLHNTKAHHLSVIPDKGRPGSSVIKLSFSNDFEAREFMKMAKRHEEARGDKRIFIVEGNDIIIGEDRAQKLFSDMGIGNFGRSGRSITDCVKYEQQQKPYFPPKPLYEASPIQTAIKNFKADSVTVGDDSSRAGKKVIQVHFASGAEADEFMKAAMAQEGGGRGFAHSGSTVIIGEDRARALFSSIGIDKFGRSAPQDFVTSVINETEGVKHRHGANRH